MKPTKSPNPTPAEPPASSWEEIVREQVKRLRFGFVQITVHEGQVTQIEATERTRLANKNELGR